MAAWAAAATVAVGLGMFVSLLSDYTTGDPEPAESVAFVADNYAALYIWNLITLIVFGGLLVLVVFALYDRLAASSHKAVAQVGATFGFIWSGLLMAAGMVIGIGYGTVADLASSNAARAESVWVALDSVGNGLSGGMEIIGPIWLLLMSLAGLRASLFPRALSYLGITMAVAGLLTVVPALEPVGAVFGLGLIVWLSWLGTILYRGAALQSMDR
jgi:hypothetical protein